MKLKTLLLLSIISVVMCFVSPALAQTDTISLGDKLQLDGGYKGFYFAGAIEGTDTIYSDTYKVDPSELVTAIYSKLLESGSGVPNIKLVRQYRMLDGGWIDVQIYAGDSSEVYKAVGDTLSYPAVECRLVAIGVAGNSGTGQFEYVVAYKEP